MNNKPDIKEEIDFIVNELFSYNSSRSYLERNIVHGKVNLKYSSFDFIKDFDRMLKRSTSFGGRHIRVNKKGKAFSIPHDPQFQLGFCKKKYKDNASIILNGIDDMSNRYASCCKAIDDKYCKRTVTSMYRTPMKARGFDPHFDMDDVIVLQVAGTKKWYFEHLAIESPVRRLAQGVTSSFNESSAVTLKPGDWYFIPAGYVHHAQCLGEESLHMTFSMHSPRTYHLFESVLNEQFEAEVDLSKRKCDLESLFSFFGDLEENKIGNKIFQQSSSFIKKTKLIDILTRNDSSFTLNDVDRN